MNSHVFNSAGYVCRNICFIPLKKEDLTTFKEAHDQYYI